MRPISILLMIPGGNICLISGYCNDMCSFISGPCRHPVHSDANPWSIPLDGQEEAQALPGVASRPLQPPYDDSFNAFGKVGATDYANQPCQSDRLFWSGKCPRFLCEYSNVSSRFAKERQQLRAMSEEMPSLRSNQRTRRTSSKMVSEKILCHITYTVGHIQ